ncbi:MAG: hypothetical protein H7256_09920 [Bdellovibrio sp.]|nr:hypothetical protein [Bdellovibrio sp.]
MAGLNQGLKMRDASTMTLKLGISPEVVRWHAALNALYQRTTSGEMPNPLIEKYFLFSKVN